MLLLYTFVLYAVFHCHFYLFIAYRYMMIQLKAEKYALITDWIQFLLCLLLIPLLAKRCAPGAEWFNLKVY